MASLVPLLLAAAVFATPLQVESSSSSDNQCSAPNQKNAQFHKGARDGAVFSSSLLSEVNARSVLDCGWKCASDSSCLTYTFIEGTQSENCRLHGALLTEADDHTITEGATSYSDAEVLSMPVNDPCITGNHAVLDDIRRDVNADVGGLCDTGLALGWYRFLLNGATAVMPTTCVQAYHCTTYATYWLDLTGGSTPAVGQEVVARACGTWGTNCCLHQRNGVKVRNCGTFMIYYLQGTVNCGGAYCAERVCT